MGSLKETVEQTARAGSGVAAAEPGVLIVLDAGQPSCRALALPRSGLELGRGSPAGAFEADERVSRRHVALNVAGGVWAVNDLGSRNGTHVNGRKIEGYSEFDTPVLVRLGESLVWAVPDLAPYRTAADGLTLAGGPVVGGLLRKSWEEIAAASRAGDTLLIRGETGAGKELAALHMHEVCFGKQSSAPFIAVNCAAIPEGLAERLLFGAKRGAYSGAVQDAVGYLASAHQGTLFLDEVAELDPLVQAKLLRVLETREVLPLGDSRPRPVQIRVCAATHKNVRDEVAAGRFRQDLYFRLGRPEVVLPALRERIDELPWLIAGELGRAGNGRVASAAFVEACALRPWPGNVRELLREVRLAAHAPLESSSNVLLAPHLPPEAGMPIGARSVAELSPKGTAMPDDERVESTLAEHQGNVTRAARALGLHRNQLRRWLAKRPGGARDDES